MVRLHQLLLACASLSAPALGGVLPALHPEVAHCAPGTKMCYDDTIYRCSSLGTWVGNQQCAPPTHCFEDKYTQDAGCVDSRAELKRDVPPPTRTVRRVPGKALSQAMTLNRAPAEAPATYPVHHTGDLRCNGPVEEIFDDWSGWVEVRRCSECFTFEDGTIDCVPIVSGLPTPTPCKRNELRCRGPWEEICVDGYRWQPLVKCFDCSQVADGVVDCVPSSLPSQPPPPACVPGELRCSGDWLQYCDNLRQWRALERCAGCADTGEGEVFCTPLATKPMTAAPTRAADVPMMTVTTNAAALETPIPALPTILAPTLAPRSVPEVGGAEDNPCFGGEVKCSGDRIDVCMSSHTWADFGPCPNCTQLYNTKVNCTWEDAAQASSVDTLLSQFIAADALPTPV
ncbi:hypothetical protein F4781DRAFT_277988 [Annulohypoxylon bovei var. microspora]|nr:hypothetical protein F4781DRAFT_277988 [Annulohypoxylon bovei var. microspora]